MNASPPSSIFFTSLMYATPRLQIFVFLFIWSRQNDMFAISWFFFVANAWHRRAKMKIQICIFTWENAIRYQFRFVNYEESGSKNGKVWFLISKSWLQRHRPLLRFCLWFFIYFFCWLLISAPKSKATLKAVPWNRNRLFIPRRVEQIEVRRKNRSDGGWRRSTFEKVPAIIKNIALNKLMVRGAGVGWISPEKKKSNFNKHVVKLMVNLGTSLKTRTICKETSICHAFWCPLLVKGSYRKWRHAWCRQSKYAELF